MASRFPVLTESDYSTEQKQVAAAIAGGPRGAVRGPFLALLHDPELARRVQHLGEYLRYSTGLPEKLTELAVLVAAKRWNCQYEWFAHSPIARKAGVSDETIAAIAAGERPPHLDDDEAAIYDFCRAAHITGDVGDAGFAAVRDRFGVKGALDLLAHCGYYSLLAIVLNSANMPLPGAAPPPLSVAPPFQNS